MKRQNPKNPSPRPELLNQKGQGLTEYITLLLLVSVCSIVAARTLGTQIKSKIETASRHIRSDLSLGK